MSHFASLGLSLPSGWLQREGFGTGHLRLESKDMGKRGKGESQASLQAPSLSLQLSFGQRDQKIPRMEML